MTDIHDTSLTPAGLRTLGHSRGDANPGWWLMPKRSVDAHADAWEADRKHIEFLWRCIDRALGALKHAAEHQGESRIAIQAAFRNLTDMEEAK